MSLRVLLVDDHQIMREGLRALLEKEKGVEVVAEAPDGRTAVQLARKLKPSLVLIDVSMPDLNGVEATRQILAASFATKVIALSMHSDRGYVTEMLKAGAAGYLLKDCAFEEVSHAIRAVQGGHVYLSPGVAGAVVEDYLERLASQPATSSLSVLSPREREVLQLISEGHSTKEIAATLHVSVKTIETHRSQVMDKLGVHSVAELTKYAVRHGLTSLEK